MKELRSFEVSARDDARVLEGVAIVFNRRALIHDKGGDYYEVIAEGALDGCDLTDSTLTVEHDTSRVPLARTPRTLQFEIKPDGLHVRAELADTAAADEAYQAVRRRDYHGLSFAFTVSPGGSHFDPKTNTRTITSIARVYETSLVAHPAYAETSVEARSGIARERERMEERRQALILCNQIIT